jgi:hypothetical protein
MSLQDLPVELVDDICQNATTTDLLAISRTTTFLHGVAQRLLYRHISVSTTSQNLSVAVTLAKRPSVALLVRSFSISADARSTIFRSFYKVLASAISNMSELVSLDMFIDSSNSWILGGDNKPVYSRMVHFTCPFSLDSNVSKFLHSTPALLELEVDSIPIPHSSPMEPLPLTLLPLLNQFIGSPQAAKAVVPGRPLESIYLNAGELTVDDVSILAKASAPVVALEALTRQSPALLLASLARHLPSLVFLRLTATNTFSNAPDVVSVHTPFDSKLYSYIYVNQEFYENIADSLASFPNLAAFELSGMHWGSQRKSDDGSRRVWQSEPLILNREDDVFFDSGEFIAY